MMSDEVSKKFELPSEALFPAGHFYSPVVDTAEVLAREDKIWPKVPPVLPGIDFNERWQRDFLEKDLKESKRAFDYPRAASDVDSDTKFYVENGLFSGLDAIALFGMLLKLKPKRVIEVGSGYSSLLTADVNNRFLQNSIDFKCIEPYPRDFLRRQVPGITQVIEEKVEALNLEIFDELGDGDILFIDSSHVAKTGSDVNYLYFSVLPRLRPGVFIHIHDIFFPYDYPKHWVINENRSWNEQYILQAMLMYSHAFKVVFGSAYVHYTMGDRVRKIFDGNHLGGGSFWMQKGCL